MRSDGKASIIPESTETVCDGDCTRAMCTAKLGAKARCNGHGGAKQCQPQQCSSTGYIADLSKVNA